MDAIRFTTLKGFEENILWKVGDVGAIPRPTQKAVDIMQRAVSRLFFKENGEESRDVEEDIIMRTIVDKVINDKRVFPGKLHAHISQNKYHATDATDPALFIDLYPIDVIPEDNSPDWTHLRLFIEVKKSGVSTDPFGDESDNPEAWAHTHAEVRKQLIECALNTFQYQHRTGLCSLLVNGSHFRAMFWDRSGLIVTNATDYVEDSGSLLRFLWAFAELDKERQGIDPTATLLDNESDEYQLMDSWAAENAALDMPYKEYDDVTRFVDPERTPSLGPLASTRPKARQMGGQPIFKYVRDGFRESLVPGWPRYQLLVGTHKRKFLVGKPFFMSRSLFGRGTRGYIALDIEDQRFVFLKDSWRPLCAGVEPAGSYLQAMASKPGVKLAGIPTVVEHGDVLAQVTHVPDFNNGFLSQPQHTSANETPSGTSRSKKRAREEPVDSVESEDSRTFIHYRIAVNEVCLQMGEFRSGKQLVRMMLDCIRTHRDVRKDFDLLHRDISTDNLLILPSVHELSDGRRLVGWHGFLTGWELARYMYKDDPMMQHVRQPEPTGTWQFMSVAHVRHPERPIAIADELESFLHVLVHQAVRHLRHSLDNAIHAFFFSYFDDRQHVGENALRCGPGKCYAVTHGRIRICERVLRFQLNDQRPDHPLNDLLAQWLSYFVARYTLLNEVDGDSDESAPESPAAQPAHEPLVEDVAEFDFMEQYALDPDEDGRLLADISPAYPIRPTAGLARAAALEQARALDTHATTIGLFKRILRAPAPPWPADDVVGDRLDGCSGSKKRIAEAMSISRVGYALTGSSEQHAPPSKKARLAVSGAAKSSTNYFVVGSRKFTKSRRMREESAELRRRT